MTASEVCAWSGFGRNFLFRGWMLNSSDSSTAAEVVAGVLAKLVEAVVLDFWPFTPPDNSFT